jgi:hypothetical protein
VGTRSGLVALPFEKLAGFLSGFKQTRKSRAARSEDLFAQRKVRLDRYSHVTFGLVDQAPNGSVEHIDCLTRVQGSLQKDTFGSNHRCVYRCPANSQRHGGPPPPLGVQGANTGFSFSLNIKHETYCTTATARPTVSTDHHAAQRSSTSGSRTPCVASAVIQRYGRAPLPR